MSINDKSIQTAAQNMINRYGDTVLQEIELRILELKASDQKEAYELWNAIYVAAKFITEEPKNRISQ